MKSLAIAYNMKKRKKMAMGGEMDSGYAEMPEEREKMDKPAMHEDEIMDEDMVSRIMRKRYSEGGRVSNGGEDNLEDLADGKPNNFDDLSMRDDLEFSYDGENSGDALGNMNEDEDRKDIVSRIMRSRMKKDRMPRPA